jgi:hypothetical protein
LILKETDDNADLELEKEKLASEKTEFEEGSKEKLLSTLIGQFAKRPIYSRRFKDCRTILVSNKGVLTTDPVLHPLRHVVSLRERRNLRRYTIKEPV